MVVFITNKKISCILRDIASNSNFNQNWTLETLTVCERTLTTSWYFYDISYSFIILTYIWCILTRLLKLNSNSCTQWVPWLNVHSYTILSYIVKQKLRWLEVMFYLQIPLFGIFTLSFYKISNLFLRFHSGIPP